MRNFPLEDWRYQSKRRIDEMDYDEAKELVLKQISLGLEAQKSLNYIGPRPHFTKALQVVLSVAENSKKGIDHNGIYIR